MLYNIFQFRICCKRIFNLDIQYRFNTVIGAFFCPNGEFVSISIGRKTYFSSRSLSSRINLIVCCCIAGTGKRKICQTALFIDNQRGCMPILLRIRYKIFRTAFFIRFFFCGDAFLYMHSRLGNLLPPRSVCRICCREFRR